MNIDRYDPAADDWGDAYMLHSDNGDWVAYAAYQDIVNKYEEIAEYARRMAEEYNMFMEMRND